MSQLLKPEVCVDVLTEEPIFATQLLEYDDVNDTAQPSTDFLSAYELQDFTWSRLNESNPNPTALLCGAARTFSNGSLCLQVGCHSDTRTSDSQIINSCFCSDLISV